LSSFFFPLEEEGLAGGAGSAGAAAEVPPLEFSGGDMAGFAALGFGGEEPAVWREVYLWRRKRKGISALLAAGDDEPSGLPLLQDATLGMGWQGNGLLKWSLILGL
jgi:hypothetical protein